MEGLVNLRYLLSSIPIRKTLRILLAAFGALLVLALVIYYIYHLLIGADATAVHTAKTGSRDWDATGTWDVDAVPASGDQVIIPRNSIVYLSSNINLGPAVYITIASGGALQTRGFVLNVKNLVVNGTLDGAASKIIVTNSFSGRGTYNAGTSTMQFTGTEATGIIDVPGTTFYNLVCSTLGKTYSAVGDITVSNIFQIDPGATFNANTRIINLKGNGLTGGSLAINENRQAANKEEKNSFIPRTEAATNPYTVNIDAAVKNLGEGKKISPLIYGINDFAGANISEASDYIKNAGIKSVRHGGDSGSRINWSTGDNNCGADCLSGGTPDFPNGKDNSWNLFSSGDRYKGYLTLATNLGALPILTVPTSGFVAKDSTSRISHSLPPYGSYNFEPDTATCQDCLLAYNPTDNQNNTSVTSGLTRAGYSGKSVYQEDFINYIKSFLGNGHSAPVAYMMDGGYDLWKETHRDIKPGWILRDDVNKMMLDFTNMVKDNDQNAITFAPETGSYKQTLFNEKDCDLSNSWTSGDCSYTDPNLTYPHDNIPFDRWLLRQAKANDEVRASVGKNPARSLDYYSFHVYPQNNACGDLNTVSDCLNAYRIRAVRRLWDPAYHDEGGDNGINGGNPLQILRTVNQWIGAEYPGTKTAITEYNFGSGSAVESDMSAGLALAEALGVLGKEGVDNANYAGRLEINTPAYLAFKLYGNAGGDAVREVDRFGDISIKSETAGSPGGDACSAGSTAGDCAISTYSAIDSAGNLTMAFLNKDRENSGSVTVNLANFSMSTAVPAADNFHQVDSTHPTSITHSKFTPAASNSFSITLAPYSMQLLTIKSAAGSIDTGTPFINKGAFNPGTGSVRYSGISAAGDITIGNGPYYNFETVGTETYNNPVPISINNNLNIASGATLNCADNYEIGGNLAIASGARLFLNDKTINIKGGSSIFSNSGAFTAGTGMVIFSGPDNSNQQIIGSSTFNNLSIENSSNSAGRTLTFAAGSTQTVTGIFSAKGGSGKLLLLKSSQVKKRWTINAADSALIYLNVSDSNNTGPAVLLPARSVDGGNNLRWNFTAAPDLPTVDSVSVQNGYGGSGSKILVTDNYTEWDILVSTSSLAGPADINLVELGLANFADDTLPYDSLKFRWERGATPSFSEMFDTQNCATLTSLSTDLSSTASSLNLHFKFKLNSSFINKDVDYNIEAYAKNSVGGATDAPFAAVYKATPTFLSVSLDQSSITFEKPGRLGGWIDKIISAVSTNSGDGYQVSIRNDHYYPANPVVLVNSSDQVTPLPNYAAAIETPTKWLQSNQTGFGFSIFGNRSINSKWGNGTSMDDPKNRYAAVPEINTAIFASPGVKTAYDYLNYSLKLIPSADQKMGTYNGRILLTITSAFH